MNIFYAYFSTGQVVEASGVTNATLQSWLKRGVVSAQAPESAETKAGIEGGGRPGVYRRFSFFSVMDIAIAKALIDAGFTDLENAFKASRHFAHSGVMASSMHPARAPACPFFSAETSAASTLIAARGSTSVEVFWKMGHDPFPAVFGALGTNEGFVVVNASVIFQRVVTALGFDPAAVMALADQQEVRG